MHENNERSTSEREWSRRSLLQGGLAGLAAVGLSGTLDLNQAGAAALAKGKTIKFGYVSPETGPLAPFGAADAFVISALKSLLAKGVTIKGVNYPIEIIVKDSQSTDATAATVAEDLIKNDKVDIMLVSSTPDTTNPVSDQWFFGRGASPTTKYKWTYHFFWGLEDIEAVYSSIWSAVATNKNVGGLWPNDSDGGAFASTTTGFPAFARPLGYNITDPGRYADGTTDFTAQIAAYRNGNCEILTGVPIPPDFTTFYKQAASQGYIPKVATIAKAMLFPSSAQALGSLAENIGTEYWWGPTHPFTSSLTKQNCAHIAAAYEKQTGDQWTQPIGFVHALFEVAIATIKQSGEAHNKAAFVSTLSKLKVNTIVGPLNWQTGPVPNVTKTPLVGGQWRAGNTKSGYALVIVTNNGHTNIPVASAPQAISGATV